MKKVFLKFRNVPRKTPVLESFFNKVAGQETSEQVFSCDFCKMLILKTASFTEHIRWLFLGFPLTRILAYST